MTSAELMRGFFAFVFSAILAWGLYQKHDPEMQDEVSMRPDRHWSPILAPSLLPVLLLVLLIMLAATGIGDSLPVFGAMCFRIFIHMSVYFIVLIILNPLLRRRINAGTCAALWLIPNMLYICEMNYMQRSTPKHIIRLHGSWLRPAVIIWLAGAAILFGWKVTEHMIFRGKIRRNSREERNPETLSIWENMQFKAKIKKADIPLLRSKDISSPLSVGIGPHSTFVVLPENDYLPEEIELILRHELIHIVRRDAQTKLFLTLCAAVCWFNPLMWIGIRRCAEDLELSCDELVLEEADDIKKRRYADLVLSSAGETKGFTSSLAPKAESLRYRLKQIMTPGKKLNGGIIAGLLLFLLLTSSGIVAFAYGDDTAAALAFSDNVPDITKRTDMDLGTRNENGGITLYPRVCTDPDALMKYISELKVSRLCGNYKMDQSSRFLEMFLPGGGGPRILFLEESCLKLTDLGSRNMATELWYLNEAPDWNYIESLLEEQNEEAQTRPPQPFNMEVVFGPESVIESEVFTASGKILENTLDGQPSDFYSGWQDAACAVEGLPVEWADISFPFAPEEGSAVVSAKAWDMEMTNSRDLSLNPDGRIELLPVSARYIVEARWEFETDMGTQIYRMEYEFDVIR